MPNLDELLPPLPWLPSVNVSDRPKGTVPHLLVLHTWGVAPALTPAAAASRFDGTVSYLRTSRPNPDSAHVVYGGTIGAPKGRAAQLVAWNRKAWTEASFNSVSYSIESADAIWTLLRPAAVKGDADYLRTCDEPGLRQLARIAGFICLRSGIPPVWAAVGGRSPLRDAGLVRHYDLGAAGGGHTDPTTNAKLWLRFVFMVKQEVSRGGYRASWGRGTWARLAT